VGAGAPPGREIFGVIDRGKLQVQITVRIKLGLNQEDD